MIHYHDERTLVEITGRVVSIVPCPADDLDRANELKVIFPERNGWTHYRYGIHRVALDAEVGSRLAQLAVERLKSEVKA